MDSEDDATLVRFEAQELWLAREFRKWRRESASAKGNRAIAELLARSRQISRELERWMSKPA